MNVVIGGVGIALIESNDFNGVGPGRQIVKNDAASQIVTAVGVNCALADPINKNLGDPGVGAGHKPEVDPGAVKGQRNRISTGARKGNIAATAPSSRAIIPALARLLERHAVVAQGRVIFFVAYNTGARQTDVGGFDSRGVKPIHRGPAAVGLNLEHVDTRSQIVKRKGAGHSGQAVQIDKAQ